MTYFFYDSNDKDLKLKNNILYLYLYLLLDCINLMDEKLNFKATNHPDINVSFKPK